MPGGGRCRPARRGWAGAAPGAGQRGGTAGFGGEALSAGPRYPRVFPRFSTAAHLFHLFVCFQCGTVQCRSLLLPSH